MSETNPSGESSWTGGWVDGHKPTPVRPAMPTPAEELADNWRLPRSLDEGRPIDIASISQHAVGEVVGEETTHELILRKLRESETRLIEAYEREAAENPNPNFERDLWRLMFSNVIAEAHVEQFGPDPAKHGTDEYAQSRAITAKRQGLLALFENGALPEIEAYDELAETVTIWYPNAELRLREVVADPQYAATINDPATSLAFVREHIGLPATWPAPEQ